MPKIVIALLEPLVERPTLLMVVLMVIVLIVGLAMDGPDDPDSDPILCRCWSRQHRPGPFGIVFVLANVLGLTSPPVGPVLNVACAAGRVKMDDIIMPVIPYWIAQSALVVVLALFPPLIMVPLGWLV